MGWSEQIVYRRSMAWKAPFRKNALIKVWYYLLEVLKHASLYIQYTTRIVKIHVSDVTSICNIKSQSKNKKIKCFLQMYEL